MNCARCGKSGADGASGTCDGVDYVWCSFTCMQEWLRAHGKAATADDLDRAAGVLMQAKLGAKKSTNLPS